MRPAIVGPGRSNAPARQAARCLGGSAPERLHSLAHLGLEPLLIRLPLDLVHVPHRGRAAVAARAGMEVLEGVEIPAPDGAMLGQQGREFVRPGTEGRGLFQQHRMAGERLAVGSAERHGVALGASPFTEIVVRRQNLPMAIDEGAHRLGVTPAEGGAPDIPRDAGQGVVVGRGPDLARLVPCFAGGSASVLPGGFVKLTGFAPKSR